MNRLTKHCYTSESGTDIYKIDDGISKMGRGENTRSVSSSIATLKV